MARTDNAICTPRAHDHACHVTIKSAANQLFPKDTIVTRDTAGRAVSPSTADSSGFPMITVAEATFDNRTGSEAGGLADAIDVQGAAEVVGFPFVGTTPIPGDRLYVVDNQTVSADKNSTRGFAGICTEVRTDIDGVAKAYFRCGPDVAGISAGAGASVEVPLLSALLLATGAPMAVFADGASAVPGVQVTASEIDSVRWNNHATPGAIVQTVRLPAPSNPGAPAIVRAIVSKVGATLADATTLTIGAFAVGVGDLQNADATFGGATSAVVGDAATTTLQAVTLTLAGADLPDGECFLTLTIKPTDGTLGTDDLCLHSVTVHR